MIAGVLQLTNKTKFGFTSRNVPIYLFRAFDKSEPLYIVGCSHPDVSRNYLALISPTEANQKLNRGNLIRLLGPCGNSQAEREAIHWTYQPFKLPKMDLSALMYPLEDGRLDLRGYRTLHIDPPGCRDVDDCITFFNGKLAITIADVGIWVRTNPDLMVFQSNGQTLYDNGIAVRPMFPPLLSEDMFSLRKGYSRYGLSLIIEHGVEPRLVPTMVNVSDSYTYEQADKELAEVKIWAEQLADKDLGNDSHAWVEALMLYYNMFVAKELMKLGRGILRVHNTPNLEQLNKYVRICPEAKHLAFPAAEYVEAQDAEYRFHWGLGCEKYTHATSPIRRWADTQNQILLRGPFDSNCSVEYLNKVSKRAKKHDRDLFFLDALKDPKAVYGVVLDTKSRVWVYEWKRCVTIKPGFEVGTVVRLTYYLDMNQPTWKKRMVIHADRDYQVSPVHAQSYP